MLAISDWMRLSRHGADLLATLFVLQSQPEELARLRLGPPHSASAQLCRRCWVYHTLAETAVLCPVCASIQMAVRRFYTTTQHTVIVRGHVNLIPAPLRTACADPGVAISAFSPGLKTAAVYLQDQTHFWALLKKYDLQGWLQNLVFHHGSELTGDLQIFTTMGSAKPGAIMGDILLGAENMESNRVRQEGLHVRFYPKSGYLLLPPAKAEPLSHACPVTDFIAFLELAHLFRKLFRPDEQSQILELLQLKEVRERKFFWGRLLGRISAQASELLERWQVIAWPPQKIKVFEDLLTYVPFR